MVAPTPVALGAISSSRVSVHIHSWRQGTQGFAAALFTGCPNTSKRNTWTARNSKSSKSECHHALYVHSTFGHKCITTSALKEHFSASLYRKRTKKGRGRVSQSSALPARDIVQLVSATVQGKSVVVVESPATAKTIEKYLRERHVVLPSFGHVRDLAAKSGSVRLDETFKLVWDVPSSARQHLNAIKAAIKGYLFHTSFLTTPIRGNVTNP